MITNIRCSHDWIENNNRLECSKCKAYKLKKIKVSDDLFYGIKSDGKKYSIRKDRNKYFYPHEWLLFYNSLHEEHKLLFDFLIKTGARIDEALHLKKTDLVDNSRKIIRLMVTKKKAKKIGEEEGKPRSFQIESSLYNKLLNINRLYIFIDADKEIPLSESKKITLFKAINIRELMKRHLKKCELDPKQYGLHNIRKTHGMWLKALDIKMEEICLRLGHDTNTYLKHYGSPSIFTGKDKELMIKILGRIYNL